MFRASLAATKLVPEPASPTSVLLEQAALPIAVVIATKNRPELLSARALASVLAQTCGPAHLVVVDDSSVDVRPQNRGLVARLPVSDCTITYLENARSPGASGSWNTALDFLLARVAEPARLFVAVLDDDDAWAATYLEQCHAAAQASGLDMVAADLRRIEALDGVPLLKSGPPALRADDFLTSNPGIQASNLFVRLSMLLAAGGFDEALSSTTDRDLCIRIADLGTVRYSRLPVPLVDHFAEPGRPRLSTRGGAAKLGGLSAFWLKYAGRMTLAQQKAHAARAAELFGWHPPLDAAPPETQGCLRALEAWPLTSSSKCQGAESFPLYVGVITADPGMLQPLLQGLASLQVSPSVRRLVVLVLNNGSPGGELEVVVEAARATGLAVAVVDESRQRHDAELGAFGAVFRTRSAGQVGIAQARTMLQRYLGELLEREPNSVGWLLDDDMRVDNRALGYLPWLPAFRDQGVDVLIGSSEGASPNPPLNGLRVQLVDLFHNLLWLRSLPPHAVLPDRSAENAALRSKYPDYYYDLSRKHTAHLEMPHWVEPRASGETVAQAYSRLVTQALGVLSAEVITRPVVVSTPADPLVDAKNSVNRGGCTFIFNPRALTQTPNVAPRVLGREARRSDMMWAIVNRHYRHLTIKAVGFPVRHLARAACSPRLDIEKVQAELAGSAVYAGLTEFLKRSPDHELDFTAEQLAEIRLQSARYLDRRLLLLEQSTYRIAGLRESIRGIANPGELDELLSHLDRWFKREQFARIRDGVGAQSAADLEGFLGSLRSVANDFAAAFVCTDFIRAQLGSSAVRDPAGNKTEVLQPRASEGHSAAF